MFAGRVNRQYSYLTVVSFSFSFNMIQQVGICLRSFAGYISKCGTTIMITATTKNYDHENNDH